MSETKFKDIARQIEQRIDTGVYQPNAKLPPHRELAAELETTPATISKAYKLLAEINRVESFVGRGTFVVGESQLNQAIQPADNDTEFNFSILQPYVSQNLASLRTAYQKASMTFTPELLAYTDHSGHLPHRKAGAIWAQRYGLKSASTNNVLLTNGAQHALSLLIETLTQPGDVIAVEALTYPGILAIASLAGRQVIGVDMDDDGLIPSALEDVLNSHKPKLVIAIPSHQNPTGITMPMQRRQAIAIIIENSSAYLVEDDIYGFLNEDTLPAICHWLPEKGIHISGLSKAISPAMRCGFVVAPDHLLPVLNAHIRANIWLASPLNFIVAEQLINSGEAFSMAEAQRDIAKQRQAIASKILGAMISESDGYHVWVTLPAHWQQERFVMEAKQRDLIVTSGSYFSAGDSSPNCVRLSLMSIKNNDALTQGLQALKALLESHEVSLAPF
ncbi:PLP-dependent aminotransferase family protein [Enterovibrio sp. ZSDZ42]|uniref:PLP-dependent aminotransferase family protein n=1 Tax=Enterovibrio gelatinilyticus TaxID=2899819 RepID=A0ABT5R2I5_9GAMM|nr:PLP-dependent aminotransferase family protein [Enterovibrio sp. ZSDZ42]MDD1794478.1 PLP-dependent aminotransferase family protein [Enterovibrio sp. ZSDZ42]